jgi:hypothetical protein
MILNTQMIPGRLKRRMGLLGAFVFALCPVAFAQVGNQNGHNDVLSDEEFRQAQKYAEGRYKEIKGEVDKDFRTQLVKTKKDWVEINKVVSVTIQQLDDFKKSKKLEIYCLKTWVQPLKEKPRKGFYLLMADPDTKKGFFCVFLEGDSKDLTLDTFGMTLGMISTLKIDAEGAVCDECEGGDWSITFIQTIATSLLKLKPVERHLRGIPE